MIKKALLLAFLSILLFSTFFKSPIFAQQGCCSWHGGISYCDYLVGRYMCFDGSYSPTCGCGIPPPPPPPPYFTTASWKFIPTSFGSYNIDFDWTDDNYSQYSIAMYNMAGGDPGPFVDTTISKWTFYSVFPGTYYVNLKKNLNGRWSQVIYWKVEVPGWIAPQIPTFTPTPTIIPEIQNTKPVLLNELLIIVIFLGVVYLLWVKQK